MTRTPDQPTPDRPALAPALALMHDAFDAVRRYYLLPPDVRESYAAQSELFRATEAAERALSDLAAPSAGPLGARLEEIERLARAYLDTLATFKACEYPMDWTSDVAAAFRKARRAHLLAKDALDRVRTADSLLSLLAALRSASGQTEPARLPFVRGFVEGFHCGASEPGLSVEDVYGAAMTAAKRETPESGAAARREDVGEELYVPGEWFCPTCGYIESRRVLHAHTGNVSVNPTPALPCPNDGQFMERMTWKRHAMNLQATMESWLTPPDPTEADNE